ncbi:Gfo/Idh/MocA family oxidoreductase [Kribbella sp. NPDC051952]|uniref:Gfo/Idh/MocA family protein n=1 Tax=Kribbella sp. NPDC051952 TaxID=3154851 RepID=UPI00342E6FDA
MDSISRATVPAAVTSKQPGGIPKTTRYAIVGNGWRASVFLRMAYLMPERFEVVGVVTRRAEAGAELERDWGVSTYRTLDDLLVAERPDFVVLSVPWPVTPELTRQLVSAGIPTLAETPPAPDLEGLRSLWQDVGESGLVQVAEQYALMPLHAARLEVVRAGLIGRPSSVHVSSTHLYHVVSMIRLFLGVTFEPATVLSQTFQSKLVDPITPTGWTHDTEAKPAETILSTIDFGEAGMGIYDFTDNQWWNPLRPDHLTVRGSEGEIHDEQVVRMLDPITPAVSRIERASTGIGMNYEGLDLTHLTLDGRVVFRNPYEGARLGDDDIAVATLLDRMGTWIQDDGPPPYPLADACQDHLIGMAIKESSETGQPVTTSQEPWASDV